MLEIITTILFASVKFAMTFPLVIAKYDFNFLEVILWTNIGGLIGIYFFAFLSEKLIKWWRKLFGRPVPVDAQKVRTKKIFTKKNRRIVRIKNKYGLIGISLTTPLLLSIPVGVFLVVRYYRSSKIKFLYLSASNLIWSVLYTAFYMFIADILNIRA